MKPVNFVRRLTLFTLLLGAVLLAERCVAQAPPPSPSATALPSETPAQFTPVTDSFDYARRDLMISMRDGVKLHTVILAPKGAKNAPILLTRTPYDATDLTTHAHSSHLGPSLHGYDNALEVILEGGYIRVVQDVRGKYGSEGDYVMNRPLHGPLNPTAVDHSTDTYDTIDWLVKNIPESNGKVGILGISYDGFTPLMALVNPHPALKVSVPMNPMVDGWMGDDWFHYGAFRQQNMPYIYEQEAFWRRILEHPAYDSWWQQQAMDRILAAQPLKVPTMLVDSLWDQEDIYGAMAVYKAIKPKDTGNDKVFLVMGPWHHGQEIDDASSLGALKFSSDTGLYFRREILAPFLARYLKDDAPKSDVAPVSAFETGTNIWRRLPAWPSGCASGCTVKPTPLYLNAGLKLSFSAPATGEAPFDEYLSDPAKPVPYRPRPVQAVGYSSGMTWSQWLVDDQREASGRPDVAVFVSDFLGAPVKISGQPIANMMASTSGTDSDWVVKLIDLYPDEVGPQPEMGAYQLMVAADIFRGRYRESFETPKALAPDKPLLYRFALPTANHVFLPGHRVMVQIQSSWFPLYDRNPQTFVPNILWAKPADYRKATQRIYHVPSQTTFIEMPLVTTP